MGGETHERDGRAGGSFCAEFGNARGEIANLIQAVPDRHVQFERALNRRNFHADVELTGGTIGERD